MSALARIVNDLQRSVAELKRRLELLPTKPIGGGGGSAQLSTLIRIDSGNTLYTGALGTILGVTNVVSTLTALPTATPGGGTYANGLGKATIVNADGTFGAAVWFANGPVNPGTGVVTPGLSVPLPANTPVTCVLKIRMPVTAGGTAFVYLPYLA